MKVLFCNSLEQLLNNYPLIKQLYNDSFTFEKYKSMLLKMIPNHYKQIAIIDNETIVAVSGYWINTKLYTDTYLEIDNFVVDENYRGKKIGNILINEIEKIALLHEANAIVLDAFATNYNAHKFYYNQGYVAKGFHFVKFLNEEV